MLQFPSFHALQEILLLDRGKEMLQRLDSARFLINQNFPRFSPTFFARRKALKNLIYQPFKSNLLVLQNHNAGYALINLYLTRERHLKDTLMSN